MNCCSDPNRTFYVLLITVSCAALSLSGCKLDNPFTQNKTDDFSASLEDEANKIRDRAQEPNWLTSVDVAMKTAKNEDKLVMALFTGTDWCTWCVKLEKEVFANAEFRDWADQNVVPLKLDFPKQKKLARALKAQNDSMLARYQQHVKGYPAVLFIDADGNVVAKMGYAKGGPENWIAKAEEKLNW